MDVSASWVRALQQEPVLWLRARTGEGRHLKSRLGFCEEGPGVLSDALSYHGNEDLFSTSEFHAGEFEVQDISSQAVGWICHPLAGQTWWDACAGEGGKMLHLADLMNNRGLIWASDRAAWRLDKLKRRAARAKIFNYRAAQWDGSSRLPTKTAFDGVLVDAPCTGIGTWQRNPQGRWTTTPKDIQELSVIQRDLLKNAARSLKANGRLVYSVCTLTREETTNVVTAFAQEHPEFEPLKVPNPFQPETPLKSHYWFWPQDCEGNGMFVAGWIRKSA
jgi:16S rRNA (cytosine967-C5)-methyltransferase